MLSKYLWLWLASLLNRQLKLLHDYAWSKYIVADEMECLALADKADTQIFNPFDDMTDVTKEEITQIIRKNPRGNTRITHDWSRDDGHTIVEDWSHLRK